MVKEIKNSLNSILSGHSTTILCRNDAEAQSPDGNTNLLKAVVAHISGFALGDSEAH